MGYPEEHKEFEMTFVLRDKEVAHIANAQWKMVIAAIYKADKAEHVSVVEAGTDKYPGITTEEWQAVANIIKRLRYYATNVVDKDGDARATRSKMNELIHKVWSLPTGRTVEIKVIKTKKMSQAVQPHAATPIP